MRIQHHYGIHPLRDDISHSSERPSSSIRTRFSLRKQCLCKCCSRLDVHRWTIFAIFSSVHGSLAYVHKFSPIHPTSAIFCLHPSNLRFLQHVGNIDGDHANKNSHDVSWGTKGDNVIHTELGAAVSAGKGEKGDIVEVEVPSEQLDIDAAYDDALANVRERRPIAEKPVNESTLKEDYYREIRTRLVLIWIVSNATLAMALTEVYSTGLSGTNGYLKCE